VSEASVSANGQLLGRIGPGLVVLIGICRDDVTEDADYLVTKTLNLRVFGDDDGRFNHSAEDVAAELLVISQFTLYADTRKGRRPSFTDAAPPDQAQPLFDLALEKFRASGLSVETGQFQAHMLVSIQNDGPVTIMLDSADRHRPRRG
jgi:D-tyrosyl-tRNA(Tyr) deacylase